ncbi:ATP-binding cassette domain-containing protein [Paenibacillus harenae]|uniref:ATP-binding cassette domain-containing protein n=1 Tax=Paenibacillus harenae TaxID=306543 RepID=UPI000409FFD4|nr:ATP-binding cassette domain-containing protein [Paenibacillus harenae]
MINLKNIFYQYSKNDNWALQEINLSIFPGEWVAIVGSNGSGKSTLAKLMNGLLIPTRGEIHFFGRNPCNENDLWEIRRMVGIVFQNPDSQIVGNTIEDDIAFSLENIGVPPVEIDKRLTEVMDQFQLYPLKNQSPHTLSPGQKQKLAIAGVLAMKPKAVIFDEASSMQSPKDAQELYRMMSDLHQQGTTIVQITHEMEDLYGCERIIVLQDGMVKLEGKPGEILANTIMMKEAGLIPPFAVRIRDSLMESGYDEIRNAITPDQLVKQICISALKT